MITVKKDRLLFYKYEVNCGNNADEGCEMVPL